MSDNVNKNVNKMVFGINARYAFRSDTLANWESTNPILAKGEPGIVEFEKNEETSELTPESQERLIKGEWLKIGDGVNSWNDLPWAKGPKGDKGDAGAQGERGDQGPKGEPGKDAVTDQTYNPESENAQSGKAVAEAIIGGVSSEEYFIITADGTVSLKPEYRGASTGSVATAYADSVSDNGKDNVGTKNYLLPQKLIIPDEVKGTKVTALAKGMFAYNNAVEEVTLPNGITAINNGVFIYAYNISYVHNTEQITSIGGSAFGTSGIKEVHFPNLTTLGNTVFSGAGLLEYADIGENITTLPKSTFSHCENLKVLKSGDNITSIGNDCFFLTKNLQNPSFLDGLTSIGSRGFLKSKVLYDWKSSGVTYGTNATSLQMNPSDWWSGATITPKTNKLVSTWNQEDPQWSNLTLGELEGGSNTLIHSNACIFFCIGEIYSALNGIAFDTPLEFERYVCAKFPNEIDNVDSNFSSCTSLMSAMGLAYKTYSNMTLTNLNAIYEAIANGKYTVVLLPATETTIGDPYHAVLVYGVNSYGEFLIADSSSHEKYSGKYSNAKYTIHPKNILHSSSGAMIVWK